MLTRARLTNAAAIVAALTLSAGAAQAVTFVGSYTETHRSADPGLVVQTLDLTPGAGTGFTFDLTAIGQIEDVNFLDIWTNEGSVEFDDLVPRNITLNLAFTNPGAAGASVGGFTGGFSLFGILQNGYLNWNGGGNGVLVFSTGEEVAYHFDNVTYNNGFGGLDEGFAERGTVTGQFELLKFGAAVPEPSTWALMILGFGGAGVALRSRRRALTA